MEIGYGQDGNQAGGMRLVSPTARFARPKARADFSNSFIRVTADEGRVVPAGENGFRVLDAGKVPVAVVIEARKGWTLVSPKSGVTLLTPGAKVRYRVRSVLGEDEGDGEEVWAYRYENRERKLHADSIGWEGKAQ